MNNDKAKSLIEESFLKPLLEDENITDISFNGERIFYQHNIYGRRCFERKVDYDEVFDFIRQLSNLCEKFFSNSEPILDISVDKYRLNAIHPSIARISNKHALTFSLRISSDKLINLDDGKFMSHDLALFLEKIVAKKMSIIIAGLTGTGKTELQKFLISKMKDNTRVIIIDNILELDRVRQNSNLDINSWQFDERNSKVSVQDLIRNALRSNPDWLIVAEARGGEMVEVINSALTGIPIISTIHSESIDTIVNRMVSMVRMNDKKMDSEDIRKDIYSHIHFYIYVKSEVDEKKEIKRFISDVAFIDHTGKITHIFNRKLGINQLNIPEDIKSFVD